MFQAFRDPMIAALKGKEEMFQNLGGTPLSRRSLRHTTAANAACCIFEFQP
jgi:hypothetical protein